MTTEEANRVITAISDAVRRRENMMHVVVRLQLTAAAIAEAWLACTDDLPMRYLNGWLARLECPGIDASHICEMCMTVFRNGLPPQPCRRCAGFIRSHWPSLRPIDIDRLMRGHA